MATVFSYSPFLKAAHEWKIMFETNPSSGWDSFSEPADMASWKAGAAPSPDNVESGAMV